MTFNRSLIRFFSLLLCLVVLSGPTLLLAAEHGGGGSEKKEGAKAENGKEEGGKKEKGGDDITGGRFDGDPIYVHVQPIILPIITERGVEQLITLLVDLQTKDFPTATDMHTNMPRLKDALMSVLYGGLSEGTLRDNNTLELEKIKKRIKKAVNKAFGEDAVLNVYIQAVSQRRI